MMDYQQYVKLFEEIINSKKPEPPYTDPNYLRYAKLNYSRMNRWQKTLQLEEGLVNELKKINRFQKWIILVEPWCGDAAPILPFLVRLAEQNPLIQYDLQLRDQEPFLINSYLTNGAKAIPKLIIQKEAGNDLFTWGPRPKVAQQLVNDLKASNVDYDTLNTQLQNWYNKDKGIELQRELLKLFRGLLLHQDAGLVRIGQ
jgi:hypothetical protein